MGGGKGNAQDGHTPHRLELSQIVLNCLKKAAPTIGIRPIVLNCLELSQIASNCLRLSQIVLNCLKRQRPRWAHFQLSQIVSNCPKLSQIVANSLKWS